ncbi:hypothetical protein ANN_02293 [Periplaneta americana]|uniref:Uncharacterized protein n=1 Tax=Periplaneta americana TaxID=6978 RepID=A0ABQ8TXI4_PERAM|nr:hypothetical protein ANN_02293 [Periplaneta americana]
MVQESLANRTERFEGHHCNCFRFRALPWMNIIGCETAINTIYLRPAEVTRSATVSCLRPPHFATDKVILGDVLPALEEEVAVGDDSAAVAVVADGVAGGVAGVRLEQPGPTARADPAGRVVRVVRRVRPRLAGGARGVRELRALPVHPPAWRTLGAAQLSVTVPQTRSAPHLLPLAGRDSAEQNSEPRQTHPVPRRGVKKRQPGRDLGVEVRDKFKIQSRLTHLLSVRSEKNQGERKKERKKKGRKEERKKERKKEKREEERKERKKKEGKKERKKGRNVLERLKKGKYAISTLNQ